MVWPVVRGTIASDFYLFIFFFNSRRIEFKIKNKKQKTSAKPIGGVGKH